MNIVFLDIDGVLNSEISYAEFHSFDILPKEKINLLNNILEKTNAFIVLSSYWRLETENTKEMLINHGIYPAKMRYLDKTSYLEGNRSAEIKDWLDNHKHDNFVILDDCYVDGFPDNFCLIDSKIGLTEFDAEKAIKILSL